MDANKWKSVLLPRDVYEKLKVISKVEGRTISGQLRIIFDHWTKTNLSDSDLEYVDKTIVQNKLEAETPASFSD
jgi:predicted DNA-binding protein|tara:strand:- start:1021 stop:1242 length:222 start_codon:yes stop_codon:yes gene_type:complete